MTKREHDCPTCRQNMREPPRAGNSRKDCPQCGQGMSKATAREVKVRLAKMKEKK